MSKSSELRCNARSQPGRLRSLRLRSSYYQCSHFVLYSSFNDLVSSRNVLHGGGYTLMILPTNAPLHFPHGRPKRISLWVKVERVILRRTNGVITVVPMGIGAMFVAPFLWGDLLAEADRLFRIAKTWRIHTTFPPNHPHSVNTI